MSPIAGSGKCGDDARAKIDDPHPIVRDIGNEQATMVAIERQAIRFREAGARGRAAVTAELSGTVTGQRGYHTVRLSIRRTR